MGKQRRQVGFTLAESLLAAVVLSVAVLAVGAALNAGHMQGAHAMHTQRATKLADELLEYLLARPYYDPQGGVNPGPELGEIGLEDFDNMDDFHGWSEAVGELTDMTGGGYPAEYEVFSRSVSANYTNVTVPGLGDPIPGLMVIVSVRDKVGQTWQVTRFAPQPTE